MAKICHISTVHPPFDQRIFHRQCWSTAKAGHDTHLIVQFDQPEAVVDGVHIHAVDTVRKTSYALRMGRRLRRLWNAGRMAQQLKADIYHLHDPELVPVGLWLKLRTRKKVIFDSHEDYLAAVGLKTFVRPLLRTVFTRAMFMIEWTAARCFDAIVTADRGVGDIYRGRYGAKRVEVVHNFPRLDLFPLDTCADVDAKPYDLVYHGTIARYYLEVAFEVAEEVRRRSDKPVRWLFFGMCVEAAWARGEIQRRNMGDIFTLDTDRIPHEQVAKRVCGARLGIIPMPDIPKLQNNVPTKLFEFMALGLPTVLTDLPPSRPFVGDGKCAIMIPADDYRAYAEAILKLLNDPALYADMARIGQERAHTQFNWEVESRLLMKLYAELAG